MATGTIRRPLNNTAVNNIGVVGVGGLRIDYLNPDGQYYLAIYKTGNNLVTLFDKDWNVIWQIPTDTGNKGSFTTEPTEEEVMHLAAGNYRLSLSATTWLPTRYGILEIIHADSYGMARFTPVNATNAAIFYRSWNRLSNTWYEDGWRRVT